MPNKVLKKTKWDKRGATFKSGSLRLEWSQSTETTGSLVGTDDEVEKPALAPIPAEAIARADL